MTLNKEYGHTSRYGRIQPLAKTKGDKQEDCWIPAVFFFFLEVVISSERRNLGCPSGWVGCSNRVAGQQCGGLAIQGIACGCMQYSVQ